LAGGCVYSVSSAKPKAIAWNTVIPAKAAIVRTPAERLLESYGTRSGRTEPST
jgi:hypothetical protein